MKSGYNRQVINGGSGNTLNTCGYLINDRWHSVQWGKGWLCNEGCWDNGMFTWENYKCWPFTSIHKNQSRKTVALNEKGKVLKCLEDNLSPWGRQLLSCTCGGGRADLRTAGGQHQARTEEQLPNEASCEHSEHESQKQSPRKSCPCIKG